MLLPLVKKPKQKNLKKDSFCPRGTLSGVGAGSTEEIVVTV
jgi:hypothetical protein